MTSSTNPTKDNHVETATKLDQAVGIRGNVTCRSEASEEEEEACGVMWPPSAMLHPQPSTSTTEAATGKARFQSAHSLIGKWHGIDRHNQGQWHQIEREGSHLKCLSWADGDQLPRTTWLSISEDGTTLYWGRGDISARMLEVGKKSLVWSNARGATFEWHPGW